MRQILGKLLSSLRGIGGLSKGEYLKIEPFVTKILASGGGLV